MKTLPSYSLFLFLMVNILFAQDPIALKLTEKEGLPDVEFYDIIEDNKGFIWLAADKGLYRFDGKEYVSYSNKEKRGLSVFGLKFDHQNQLWCNNISGQFFFLKDNSLMLFLDLKNELKGELAEFLFLDNKLFIFSTSLLFSVDLKTKERKKILLPSKSKSPIIRAPYKLGDKIHFTYDDIVFSISKANEIEILNYKTKKFGSNIFPKFFEYQKKCYLLLYDNFMNKNQIFQIQENDLKEVSFPEELQNNRIITISENDGNLWLCSSNGIIILNRKNNQFTLKDVIFKNDFITKSIVDKNETVWVSTLNNGVFIIPSLQIKSYLNVVNNEVISAVEKITTTKIAVGTTKGNLFILDLTTGIKDKVEIKNKRKVSALLFLRNENVLLISTEEAAYGYHLNSKKSIPLESITNAKDFQQIDNSNQLIFSGFDRATILKFENNNLTKVKDLNFSRAYRSYSDKETHEVFVSYVDNLIVYDSTFKAKILKYNNKSIIAKDICQTADKIVWVATFTDGILGYKNGKFVNKLDLTNGLKSKIIQKIKCDNNNLWIVTDNGIQVFNSNINKFKPSLISKSSAIGNIKGVIVNEKSILFASQEDFFEIDKNITPKSYPKEIYIRSITINEKDTLLQANYSLPYDKNRIKIAFHVNGYYPEDELLFEYKLSGLNENWIALDRNVNFVNFNSLPSREYVFEIRTKSSNGSEYVSEKIVFEINQPYWKKWWFVLVIFLIALGLIILFYRNKLAVKEKEKELALKNAKFESELAVLKLENLKSQMNPHFIFNALNSIQEYIVLNQKNLASSYLAKFADLIRAYLDHSSKGYISLKEEIECLNIYLELEKLRFEEKFGYKIISLESNEDIKIPTMLIQPYVENAIKHGLLHKKTDRVLEIFFEILKEEQMLKCTVSDNGIGRERASQLRNKKYQSFATKANKNRLELLNFGKEKKIGVTIDDLINANNEPIGTQVTLLIPILK
ncbi:histidine kinase [Flavobacterium piscis]|uniref:Ligand-binding sensor domain-containing protein n=1 Tax=Flavobacterium piscis TaxID=1114874 RepID=A0ABU1YC06_9FLAO|nr:histidine kinase [Flavobacterium piscis]MDR7211623.1 ligand-binding sensor domain-containing protein [Flavobacterium piscis]